MKQDGKNDDNRPHTTGNPDPGQGASLSSLVLSVVEVLDALPYYVLLVDRNHNILLANKATRDSLGLEPHQIVGEFCPKIVHGVEVGSTYPGCPLEEAVKTGLPVEQIHFDEEKGRWLKVAIYPTSAWSIAGESVFFHTIEDITEQKKQMDQLDECEEKYRKLVEKLKKSEE